MTHTDVREIADKAILDVPVEQVTEAKVAGTIAGGQAGAAYAIAHNGSANLVTLRCRLKGVPVLAADRAFKADGADFPAGSFIVPVDRGGPDVHATVRSAVEQLGLTGAALTAMPDVPAHEVDLPRLAVYSTWGSTQEVGWVRHALDTFEVPYDLIYKERVKKGGLRSAYDVIVVPNQGRTAKGLVYDIEPKGRPIGYTKTDRFKNLGMYGESEDVTGGMGLAGVGQFQAFVNEGGVLITLGSASAFPAEFGIARRIDASRPSGQFYAPGPIVEAEIVRPEHPIFYGYTEKTIPVRYANGPLLQVRELDRGQVLMRFPGGEGSVLSGLMRGANEIRNRPAVVDVPVGKGRVVLFATNPCYRWQNLGEFTMLFNAVLHWNDVKASEKSTTTTAEGRP